MFFVREEADCLVHCHHTKNYVNPTLPIVWECEKRTLTGDLKSMWVLVKTPEGKEVDRDLPETSYLQIGDILEDGSVVIDLKYPDDEDDDLVSLGYYGEDDDY